MQQCYKIKKLNRINILLYRNDRKEIIITNYFAGDTGFFSGVCLS